MKTKQMTMTYTLGLGVTFSKAQAKYHHPRLAHNRRRKPRRQHMKTPQTSHPTRNTVNTTEPTHVTRANSTGTLR
jgi:hypothetical protein